MDMDDLDLYDDLDDFQKSEEKKISEIKYQEWNHATKYEESVKTIESLKLEIKDLKKKNRQIEISFQNLLDTAKAELRRKDKLLDEVRKEKDDICFRRKFPKQARGYQEQQKHQREESADNKNLFKQCSQSLFVEDATKTLSGPSTANYVELTNVIVANESETACRSNCELPERESRKRDRVREAEGRHGSCELEGKQRHIGNEVKVGHRSRALGQHSNDPRDRDARDKRNFAEENRRSYSRKDYKHNRSIDRKGGDRRETERQQESPKEGRDGYPKENLQKSKEEKKRISHDKNDSAHCNEQERETTTAKKLVKSKVNQENSKSLSREEETQRDNYSEMCQRDGGSKVIESSSTMKMISEQPDYSSNGEEETKQSAVFEEFVKAGVTLTSTSEELMLKCAKSTKAESVTAKEVLEKSCIDLLTLSACNINSFKISEKNIKNSSPTKADPSQYLLGQSNSSSPIAKSHSVIDNECANRKINVKEDALPKSVEVASERVKEIELFESIFGSVTSDGSSTSPGSFRRERKKAESSEIVKQVFYDLTSDTDEKTETPEHNISTTTVKNTNHSKFFNAIFEGNSCSAKRNAGEQQRLKAQNLETANTFAACIDLPSTPIPDSNISRSTQFVEEINAEANNCCDKNIHAEQKESAICSSSEHPIEIDDSIVAVIDSSVEETYPTDAETMQNLLNFGSDDDDADADIDDEYDDKNSQHNLHIKKRSPIEILENIRIPNIYEVRMTARLNLVRRNMKEKKRELSATKEYIVESIDITDDDNGSILPHNNTNLISIESAVEVDDDAVNGIAQLQEEQSTIKELKNYVKVKKISETEPHVDEKEKLSEIQDSEKQSMVDKEEIQAQVNEREIFEEKEDEKQEALRENCELGEGNQSKERTTQMNEYAKNDMARQADECVIKRKIQTEKREIQGELNGTKADLSGICTYVSSREMQGSQIKSEREILAEEKAVKIKEREIHVIGSEIQLKPSTTEQKERAIKSKLSQTLIKVSANQSEVQREIHNEESFANIRVLLTKEKEADEAKKIEHQVEEVENKDETQASEGATPANVRETQADIRVNQKQPNKNNIQVRKSETNITKSIENGEEEKEVQTNIKTESQVGLNIIPRSKRRDIPVAKRESQEEELAQSEPQTAERKDPAKEEAILEGETWAYAKRTEEKQKKSKIQGEIKADSKINKTEIKATEKETWEKPSTNKIQRRGEFADIGIYCTKQARKIQGTEKETDEKLSTGNIQKRRESIDIRKHSKKSERDVQEEGKETQLVKRRSESNAFVTIGTKRKAHEERDRCEERKCPPKTISAIGILRQTAVVQQKRVRKPSLDADNINLQRTKMRKISLDEDQLFSSMRDNMCLRPSLTKYKIPKMSKIVKLPELGKNLEHADECVAKNDKKSIMQNMKTLKERNVEENDIEKKQLVNIKKRIQNEEHDDESISLNGNRKNQLTCGIARTSSIPASRSSSSMSASVYRTDEEEGVSAATGTQVENTLETAMQQLRELQNNKRKNPISNATNSNQNAVDFILNNASFNQDRKQQAAAAVLEEMSINKSSTFKIEDNIQSKAARKKIKATDTNSTVVEVVKLKYGSTHDENILKNNVKKPIAIENVHSFEKEDAVNKSKKSFHSQENITKNGNEIMLKAVNCEEMKKEDDRPSVNTKEVESSVAAIKPTTDKSSKQNHSMHKSKTHKHKRCILHTTSDEDDVPVQINTKKSLSKDCRLTSVQQPTRSRMAAYVQNENSKYPLNNSLLRLASDLTDDTNTAVHETLQADTQKPASMSVCQSPQEPTDEKFRLLDSDLCLIFQSPDPKLSVSTPNKLDDFNISQSPPTNSANVATETTATNVTIEETANASKLLQQGCETSLNDSNASMETKHMSLGSSDYRFERVNENVINLFISRKRRRGGTKKRQLAGDDEQHTFS